MERRSKNEPTSKLHASHVAKGASDLTRGRAIYRGVGGAQVGAIEGVQHHPLKLQVESL